MDKRWMKHYHVRVNGQHVHTIREFNREAALLKAARWMKRIVRKIPDNVNDSTLMELKTCYNAHTLSGQGFDHTLRGSTNVEIVQIHQ